MGNILDHPSAQVDPVDADIVEDDHKWLSASTSIVFNEDFLEDEYANLPVLNGTQLELEDGEGGDVGIGVGSAVAGFPGGPSVSGREVVSVQRMLQLLRQGGTKSAGRRCKGERATSVEDFPELLGEGQLKRSPHAIALIMRSRLYERMYLALLRQSFRVNIDQREEGEDSGLAFALAPHKFSQSQAPVEVNVLLSMTLRGQLKMMKILGPAFPNMFLEMTQTFLDLFASCPPFGLAQVESNELVGSLHDLRTLARDTASSSTSSCEDKAQAMSLLLAVGVVSGSIADVVCVASYLLSGGPSLPPSSEPFLNRLREHSTSYMISFPTPDSCTASFPARLGMDRLPNENTLLKTAFSTCNLATDGVYLYVWEPVSKTLYKIGTGFHNTLAGNVYCKKAGILDAIKRRKGIPVEDGVQYNKYQRPSAADIAVMHDVGGDDESESSYMYESESEFSEDFSTDEPGDASVDVIGGSHEGYDLDPNRSGLDGSSASLRRAGSAPLDLVHSDDEGVYDRTSGLARSSSAMSTPRSAIRMQRVPLPAQPTTSTSGTDSAVGMSRNADGAVRYDQPRLHFRSLDTMGLVSEIPPSGEYDETAHSQSVNIGEDQEGEVLERRMINNNIWYRVRTFDNEEGWTPLMVNEDDDSSADGEILELVHPDTGDTVDPLSDLGMLTNAIPQAHVARGVADVSMAARAGPVAPARPVWLVCVGGRLFLREKVSGALEVGEVAVLSMSNLQMEKIISLAHLPIPGFPGISETSAEDEEKEDERLSGNSVNEEVTTHAYADVEEQDTDFADASRGAVVMECSSNAQLSDGILQNNLLVINPRERLHYPPRARESEEEIARQNTEGFVAAASTTFYFAQHDRDRVVVVALDRVRVLRRAGVELYVENAMGFNVAHIVGRLVVETSQDGESWRTMGEVELLPDAQTGNLIIVEAEEQQGVGAMFIRCSLSLPTYGQEGRDGPPACRLSRIVAFGPLDSMGLGSSMHPFPAMTSDSRHLILVHSRHSRGMQDQSLRQGASDKDDGIAKLDVYYLDPQDDFKIVKTVQLGWGVEESLMEQSAILCNGTRLMLLGPPEGSTVYRSSSTETVCLRCRVGVVEEGEAVERDEDVMYQVQRNASTSRRGMLAAPQGLVYDQRNNMIWGWDPAELQLCRWRNKGLAPVFLPPLPGQRPSVEGEALERAKQEWLCAMLTSSAPQYRLEVLEALGEPLDCPKVEGQVSPEELEGLEATRFAAVLMCHLERMGEPFGPPEEAVAEARSGCELEASSGGLEDGNFSRLLVRGEDACMKEAGINVVVMDEGLNFPSDSRHFATQDSEHTADRLADFINGVTIGLTVMIAVQHDCSGHMTPSARKALVSVGACRDNVMSLSQHKFCSFAMIGKKGAKPGTVPQVLRMRTKGSATVRQRLPTPSVHMCVDVSRETLHSLVELILQHQEYLKDSIAPREFPAPSKSVAKGTLSQTNGRANDEMTRAEWVSGHITLHGGILLSVLNVLTTQIYQLLRGSTAAQVVTLFSADHLERLQKLLLRVVDQVHTGKTLAIAVYLSRACLRLFVAAMDIFYPTCEERCSLLVHYLDQYVKGDIRQGKLRALKLLMRRMSGPAELAKMFCAYPSRDNPFPKWTPARNAVKGRKDEGSSSNTENVHVSPMTLLGALLNIVVKDGSMRLAKGVRQARASPYFEEGDFVKDTDSDPLCDEEVKEGVEETKGDWDQSPPQMKMETDSEVSESGLDVGAAAVEMLGRLCNQIVSRAARLLLDCEEGEVDVDQQSEASGTTSPSTSIASGSPIHGKDRSERSEMSQSTGRKYYQGHGVHFASDQLDADIDKSEEDGGMMLMQLCQLVSRACLTLMENAIKADAEITRVLEHMAKCKLVSLEENDLDGYGNPALAAEVDQLLQESLLGSLLPTLLGPLTLLATKCGRKSQMKLGGMADCVSNVMRHVSTLIERIPSNYLKGAAGEATSVSKRGMMADVEKVMESAHDYLPDTQELIELHIPGAVFITVVFDERTRTENSYDYLIFWKDEEKTKSWHPGTPCFSGLGSESNFPGLRGIAPLVIEGDRAWVEWKTDRTNQYWGWRFTATGRVKNRSLRSGENVHWLVNLDLQLASFGAALAASLVTSVPWAGKSEDDTAPWMEDELLAGISPLDSPLLATSSPAPSMVVPDVSLGRHLNGGLTGLTEGLKSASALTIDSSLRETICSVRSGGIETREVRRTMKASTDQSETGGVRLETEQDKDELLLLREMVDRKDGSLGYRLCKEMKGCVQRDQGNMPDVNRAVYATCAALIYHRGLAGDALDFALQKVVKPSEALKKTWRFGQEIRRYLNLGDVQGAITKQKEVQRQQAVAAETSTRRGSGSVTLSGSGDFDAQNDAVTKLQKSSSVYKGAEDKVIREVSDRIVERSLFLLTLSSQARMIAKRGGHKSTAKSDGHASNKLKKLDPGRDDPTAMSKYKNTQINNIKLAKIAQMEVELKSVAERIMTFVKVPTNVEELLKIRRQRDKRAQLRSKGINLFCRFLLRAGTNQSKSWILVSLAQAIRDCKRNERPGAHVHFLSCVEGCDPKTQSSLANHFKVLMGRALFILKEYLKLDKKDSVEMQPLAVSALQSISLDYDADDHHMLDQSDLLQVVESLLEGVQVNDGTKDTDQGGKNALSGVVTSVNRSTLDLVTSNHAPFQGTFPTVSGSCPPKSPPRHTGVFHDMDLKDPVRRAAWSLFELLLPRCVGLEGQGEGARVGMVSNFSHRLQDVLVRQVDRASSNVQQSNESLRRGLYAHWELSNSSWSSSSSLRPRGEGTRSPSQQLEPRGSPVLPGGVRIGRDVVGCVAPHRHMGLRHTVSLWLRRDRCPLDDKPELWDAPAKKDDLVARGPDWVPGKTEDGNGGLGKVISESNNMVDVKWESSGHQGNYSMGAPVQISPGGPIPTDPQRKVWEVIRVDRDMQGLVYMKGARARDAWSRFGLALEGDAKLRYFANSGEDQIFSLNGKKRVKADTWTHVAVVQAKNRCRIYVDGEEDVEAKLPTQMLYPDSQGKRKPIVESLHPYMDNTDRYWDVSVEDAVSYTIVFDPKSRTEPNHDFVKFVKDRTDPDSPVYGPFSGASSNWPGVGGTPPLVIGAPSFSVYFHSDESNTDWGFKLTATASTARLDATTDDTSNEVLSVDLNPFPIYLGQPPGYISNARSARGYLWRMSTFDNALTADQVKDLAKQPAPSEPLTLQEGACVEVLSLMRRCAGAIDTARSLDDLSLKAGVSPLEYGISPLVSPKVLGPVLVLLLEGSFRVRLTAARLCEALLPQASPEMVQEQLVQEGFNGHAALEQTPFVRNLMLSVGKDLSVWSRHAEPDSTAQPSAEEMVSLAFAHVRLLRSLATNPFWSRLVMDCMLEACHDVTQVVKILEEAGKVEAAKGNEAEAGGVVKKALEDKRLWMVHACLALLGGSFLGLHVGGRAKCLVGRGDCTTLESGTVLAMDWPQPHLNAVIERNCKAASHDGQCEQNDWEACSALGDAVVVCLDSEPDKPRTFPRTRVSACEPSLPNEFLSALRRGCFDSKKSYNCTESESKGDRNNGLEETVDMSGQKDHQRTVALETLGGSGEVVKGLVKMFSTLSAGDAMDTRPRHKPLYHEEHRMQTVESEHPHRQRQDNYTPLDFPGAKEIEIEFDESCRTCNGEDYVRILKDESHLEAWGESKYHGRDHDENWPGVRGRPKLIIPTSKCIVHFHTEWSQPDWGFRLKASAICVTVKHPAEREPLLSVSCLATLKACGAKALLSMVKVWPDFVLSASKLIKPLATCALRDARHDNRKNPFSGTSLKLSLESNHPYHDNANRCEWVRIKGARKLLISFDPKTRTEASCDYLVLYRDDSCTTYWGEAKYSGGKDGSSCNWPGIKGRPPLEIPAGKFYLCWVTDATVNDWGWKMTVKAVMDKINPVSLPPPLLDSKLSALMRFGWDCPNMQPKAVGLERFEEEPAPQEDASMQNIRNILRTSLASPSTPAKSHPEMLDRGREGMGGKARRKSNLRVTPLQDYQGSNRGSPDDVFWTMASPSPRVKGPGVQNRGGKGYPRIFVVNPRDADVVCLREGPSAETNEVHRLLLNHDMYAIKEDGDWLKGIYFKGDIISLLPPGWMSQGAAAGFNKDNILMQQILPQLMQKLEAGESLEGDVEVVWAQRRDGDRLYMVPKEDKMDYLITLEEPDYLWEGDGEGADIVPYPREAGLSSGASTQQSNPAFQVVDPPGEDEGITSTGAFGLGLGEELNADRQRVWSGTAEVSRAAALCYSKQALTLLLAGWPSTGLGVDNISLSSLDLFGPEMFILLLRKAFNEKRNNDDEAERNALEVLKGVILESARRKGCFKGEDHTLPDYLIAYSLYQLQFSVSLMGVLPPTKAVLRAWETPHNYEGGRDTDYTVSIPGAKRIRVIFDNKCATEFGTDYVRLYKDASRIAYWGEQKYHGGAGESTNGKIWAGVDGQPPLEVLADSFIVHFHSDQSNSFWGAKLYAYGIMQEPSAEDVQELKAQTKEVGHPETELACWIMETLAKETDPRIVATLHRLSTMQTLRSYLESARKEDKIWVVHLLTAILQDIGKSKEQSLEFGRSSLSPKGASNSGGILTEVKDLVMTINELTVKQAKEEEARGVSARSPLLQALVQAFVVADQCLKRVDRTGRKSIEGIQGPKGTFNPMRAPSSEDEQGKPKWPETAQLPQGKCLESIKGRRGLRKAGIDRSDDPTMVIANPGYDIWAGIVRWDIYVRAISSRTPMAVGIGAVIEGQERPGEAGWWMTWNSMQSLQVKGSSPACFGPKFRTGDIISVVVDTFQRTIVLYRNQAVVGLALGPYGSEASVVVKDLFNWTGKTTLHPLVILAETGDEVELVAPRPTRGNAGAAMSGNRSTGWFENVKQSLELLTALGKREVPLTLLATEFLPQCQQQMSQIIEWHPLGTLRCERSVTIPGASSLEVCFDKQTFIGHKDSIHIRGSEPDHEGRILVGLEGGTDPPCAATSSMGLSIGDRVVRGPSWDWGDKDGGPGGYGVVVEIKAWKGKPRAGIKVHWEETNKADLYKWDYEGAYDLLVVGEGDKSTKSVLVYGDTLTITVEPASPTLLRQQSTGIWNGGLRLCNGGHVLVQSPTVPPMDGELPIVLGGFNGDFTIEMWVRLEVDRMPIEARRQPILSRGVMAGLLQICVIAFLMPDSSGALVQIHMDTTTLGVPGLSFSGGMIIPNQWTHLALVMVSNMARLVIDGREVASAIFQGPRMVLEEGIFQLGRYLPTNETMTGHIHDFRLWSRALSVSEIASGRKTLPDRGSDGLLVNFPFMAPAEGSSTQERQRNRGLNEGVTAELVGGCSWDTTVDPPTAPTIARKGWGCMVLPTYPLESLSVLKEFKPKFEEFTKLYGGATIQHDLDLVRYVNSYVERKGFNAQRLLRCSWEDMEPGEDELVRLPLLKELVNRGRGAQTLAPEEVEQTRGELSSYGEPPDGVEEVKGSEGEGGEGTVQSATSGEEGLTQIAARFKLLQLLNQKLRDALPYLDLAQMDRSWSAVALLLSCRGLVFRCVKEPVWEAALNATKSNGHNGTFDLYLSRPKAARHIHVGEVDLEGRWSVFGQAFRQIHVMHPRCLRTNAKLYNCVFMGEHSQDAGGPYRETWSIYAQELQSSALPLLVRSPNALQNVRSGRESYLINPAVNDTQKEMLVFLGKLMGHAIRSKEFLALKLSSIVWKALVCQKVTREDLDDVDYQLLNSMKFLHNVQNEKLTKEEFNDLGMCTFSMVSLDQREVELWPGGSNVAVTWDNSYKYAEQAEAYRLRECTSMVKYIREGMASVVPVMVLGLFTWEEVETMVCGKPEVDIDLLEAVTEYSGCRKEQPHIALFWQALRAFNAEERSMFLKFTWGRARLPLSADGFSQRFKLQSFGKKPAENYYPVAHTCFFSLELPAYSSLTMMMEKLRYAIYNCQAIDGDDTETGAQAAALGWDWEER